MTSLLMLPLEIVKWQLLIAAFVIVGLLLLEFLKNKIAASTAQALIRAILICALTAPIVSSLTNYFVSPSNVLKPTLQVGPQISNNVRGSSNFKASLQLPQAGSPLEFAVTEAQANGLGRSLLILFIAHILFFAFKLARDFGTLRKILKTAVPIRSLGKVRIFVSDKIRIPLALHSGRNACVLLPIDALSFPKSLRMILKHELQHHRNRDLTFALLSETLRLIAGWNPLVRLWLKRLEEIDELACDDAVLGRQSVEPTAYATCLYEFAQAATLTGKDARLAGTAGMAAAPDFLKRRIAIMFQKRKTDSRLFRRFLITGTALVLTATAWTANGWVKDRNLTLSAAQKLARTTQAQSGIPVVMNKRVLYWLNQATGSASTRFYMRQVLKRMQATKSQIDPKLVKAGFPLDILAVPAIETGYQNTQEVVAAGIWSFVPNTARRYGLRVDDQVDERLDIEKETDAAIAYLSDTKALFNGDWHLALLAYNIGESSLQKIVAKAGYRDVFKLADEGFITEKSGANYIPKFLAALIIINNPDLVAD